MKTQTRKFKRIGNKSIMIATVREHGEIIGFYALEQGRGLLKSERIRKEPTAQEIIDSI